MPFPLCCLLVVSLLAALLAPHGAQAQGDDAGACAYDLTGDGAISTNDLLMILALFGRQSTTSATVAAADVSGDGIVGTSDLLGLLAVYGRSCGEAPAGPEAAAAAFAEVTVDPFTPLVAVSSAIYFDGGDLSAIESGQGRTDFDREFSAAMAGSLGDGSTVSPESIIVDEIREVEAAWEGQGRRRLQTVVEIPMVIEVTFYLLLPATLQSHEASLITAMQETEQTIEIEIAAVSFTAEAASMTPPTSVPAVVDCEGAWVPSADECSEPCGPDGVRAQSFVVFRAEQNGGSNCVDAGTLPEALPCNTHVQCPVDCGGEWGEWGDCSLPCGTGTQMRSFVVLQEPQHGGACPDRDTSQSQECNTQACPPPPPEQQEVDCVGTWSEYGACSHTCGADGLQQRTFAISQVASNGGSACAHEAGDVEAQSCNTEVLCPIDCDGEWSDFGACSEVCGPGTRTRYFQVTAAAQFGGSCAEEGSTQSEDCDNLCPAGLEETDVAPGPITLPVASTFELATLVQVLEGETHLRGSAIPVARSYNNNEWEGTMPSPVSFDCTETLPVMCSATLPAGATYQLRIYDGSALVSQDPKLSAARFLTQATFGPTLDEIDNLSAATAEETEAAVEDWLYEQMEMEPSLHRVYLRQRTNTLAGTTFPEKLVRPPCSEASSWVTFAFSKFDYGKEVVVSLNADGQTYSLSIEGIVRTVVESVKDIREDIGWSCYKRGFRTPLDMPGTTPTDEASVEACHERCASTDGCGYFSFDEDNMECHLQAPSASGMKGSGGPWRTGPVDCSASIYTYPPTEAVEGLENMGAGCWAQCNAHGPCPGRCGANGYCCRFGRDIGGCITTDPTASTHRCIPNPSMPAPPPAPAPHLQANTSYRVCFVNEYEGGDVSLLPPGVDFPAAGSRPDWKINACPTAGSDQIIIGNPRVNLLEPDMFITQQLDGIDLVPMPVPLRNSYSLRNIIASCELPPNPTVFIYHDERYYRSEPRVQLVDNTVADPYIEDRTYYQRDRQNIPSLTSSFCPAAQAAFTNAEGCVRQNSCSQPEWTQGTVVLDDNLMRQLFTKSQKLVYSLIIPLDGLSDEEISPCSAQTRWKKTAGTCDLDTPLEGATLASLSAALQQLALEAVLVTPDLLIIEAVQGECATELNGVSIVGAKVTLNGTCFEQVHPDSYNVYDMAYWVGRLAGQHSGFGGSSDAAALLTRPATLGQTNIELTSICESGSCWPTSWSARNPTPLVRLLGVLGQELEFSSLPTTVQVPWLAEFAGVEDVSVDPGVSESCGSIGEVANDPAFGHKYGGRYVGAQKPTYWPLPMLWQNAVFHAEDQLRQRVAWGLSQIYGKETQLLFFLP